MELKKIIQKWLLLVVGIFLAAKIIPGISYDSNTTVIAVVIILSFLNLVFRPLLVLLALPFVVLTMGFGILIINAFLFLLAGELIEGFHVTGFASAFWGSIIVSLTSLIANSIIRSNTTDKKQMTSRNSGRDDIIDI